MAKHIIDTVDTPYGYMGVCSCKGHSLGFFSSPARAKRAMMNTTHGEEQRDVRRVEDGNK